MDEVIRVSGLIPVCLCGGLLLFVGGVMIMAFLLTVWEGIRTRSWPAIVGRIITSGMATEKAGNTLKEGSFSGQAGVVYEYEVDGKRFTKVAGRLILALEAAISTVPLKPLFSGVDGSTFGSFKTPWPTSPSHL